MKTNDSFDFERFKEEAQLIHTSVLGQRKGAAFQALIIQNKASVIFP